MASSERLQSTTVRQSLRARATDEEVFVDSVQLKRVLSVLLPSAVYVGAIMLLGLYVASALFIALFMIINVAFYPSLEGQPELDQAMQDLPPAVQELFGIQEGVSLSAPAGYLQSQVFAMLPLLLAVLGIAVLVSRGS